MTQGDELFAQGESFFCFEDVLAAFALDRAVLGRLHDRVEVPVLCQQLGGRLDPDAVHARDVVRRVAHQGQQIDDLIRADPQILHQVVLGDQLVLVQVVHLRRGGAQSEQLLEVLVLGDDPHTQVRVGLGVTRRERRQHIVGLEPLAPDHWDTDRLERLDRPLDLRHQVLGRRVAVGLVLREELRAEGAVIPADIQRDGDMRHPPLIVREVRAIVLEQLDQHPNKPIGHIRRLARNRRGHGRADRVVCPEELGEAVDEVECFHHPKDRAGSGMIRGWMNDPTMISNSCSRRSGTPCEAWAKRSERSGRSV